VHRQIGWWYRARVWNTVLWLAVIAGCGRVGFDSLHSTGGSDGGSGGSACTGPTTAAQSVYLKASNTGAQDVFDTVALSGDGTTLAVGALGETSAATGINGNQADNTISRAGAVYVFTATGASWSQQAYIKASNTDTEDWFGSSAALSADGNTLAVGAVSEESAATGINGDQTNNSLLFAGAVYVFSRSGTTWAQQAYIKASNTGNGDDFGTEVALSADGNTLAVGAQGESSSATGINGNQTSNTAFQAGAVYVFVRSGTTWTQQAYIKASNTGATDLFGTAIALSADGNTLAVGAPNEASTATGIGGNQNNNTAAFAGASYVFIRTGTTWSQQAYIKASNTEADDSFGRSVALSSTGDTLAVGAIGESSSAVGVNGNQADNAASGSGAVYVFTRVGASWAQQAYVKASNTGMGDGFGRRVALSGNGNLLAVGAANEDSAATCIGGNQADDSQVDSGATYLFGWSGASWSQLAYIKASNTDAGDAFGYHLVMAADASTLVVSAYAEASSATGVNGDQTSNAAPSSGAVYVFR
jgi:hypothetical protein